MLGTRHPGSGVPLPSGGGVPEDPKILKKNRGQNHLLRDVDFFRPSARPQGPGPADPPPYSGGGGYDLKGSPAPTRV